MARVKHNALHQFTAGLNNAPANHPASQIPVTCPVFQGWKEYYEPLTLGATYASDAYWEILAISSGTFGAGDSNSIKLTAATTTDNSGYSFRHDTATMQPAGATKKYYFETIVKLTHSSGTMAANEWFLGYTNDEVALAAGGTVWDFENGFGFGQIDGGTPVFVTNDSDSEQSIPLSGTLVTATYRKYACYFDGTNYNLYEDDVLITQVVANPVPVADAPLGFSIHYKSGEAKTNDFQAKYSYLAYEL